MVLNFGPPGPAPQVLGFKAYTTIPRIFIYVGRVWVQAGMWSLEPTLQEAFPSLWDPEIRSSGFEESVFTC